MDTQELMTKVAEVAPEQYAYITASADEVGTSPFRDEIVLELEGIVKHAGLAGRFGNAMAGIGTSVGAGIAYSLAGDMYDAVRRGITKNRNYKDMMNQNPDLEDLPAKNVQQAFSALHRFNPEFASDPTVAGSFVRRQATLVEFDPNVLSNLVSARKNLKDIKSLPIPGRTPWDKPEEKEQRKLQTEKLRQDISGAESGKDRDKLDLENARMRNSKMRMDLNDQLVSREREGNKADGKKVPTARMRKYLAGE